MSSDSGAVVAVSDLRHSFDTRAGDLVALEGVTFTVEAGGYAAMVGPSGAGKTTLLSIIGGLERPQAGSVYVHGHDLSGLEGDELASYRRDTVGFVFQHFGLLDALTAIENVELALTLDRADRRTRRRRASELLDAVGLGARADHRPVELSGGERQRVAIARALTNRPRLLLADEPTGNLDERAARDVIELLETGRATVGYTLVVVTHNPVLAGRAEQRLALTDGHLAATTA